MLALVKEIQGTGFGIQGQQLQGGFCLRVPRRSRENIWNTRAAAAGRLLPARVKEIQLQNNTAVGKRHIVPRFIFFAA